MDSARGKGILIAAGWRPRKSVAPKGAVCGRYFLGLRGPMSFCRAMITPRRRVSCRRGAGDGGDCEPECGAAPVLLCRTGRRHGELDASGADAHQRADLEQLEPDGAAGRLREVGIVEPD